MSLSFPPLLFSQPSSLSTHILRVLASLGRAWTNRRQIHRLLDLDDRLLKDIGLTRSDVVGALELPLDRDPSILLAVRSVSQRARRRDARDRVAASGIVAVKRL